MSWCRTWVVMESGLDRRTLQVDELLTDVGVIPAHTQMPKSVQWIVWLNEIWDLTWAAWLRVVGSGLIRVAFELGMAQMVIRACVRQLALVLQAPSYVVTVHWGRFELDLVLEHFKLFSLSLSHSLAQTFLSSPPLSLLQIYNLFS